MQPVKVQQQQQHMFTPCVAFRVVGTPLKHVASKSSVPAAPYFMCGIYCHASFVFYCQNNLSSAFIGLAPATKRPEPYNNDNIESFRASDLT